jgi:hypothetical protein
MTFHSQVNKISEKKTTWLHPYRKFSYLCMKFSTQCEISLFTFAYKIGMEFCTMVWNCFVDIYIHTYDLSVTFCAQVLKCFGYIYPLGMKFLTRVWSYKHVMKLPAQVQILWETDLWSRVVRFSLVQTYQTWKKLPNQHNIYQMAVK